MPRGSHLGALPLFLTPRPCPPVSPCSSLSHHVCALCPPSAGMGLCLGGKGRQGILPGISHQVISASSGCCLIPTHRIERVTVGSMLLFMAESNVRLIKNSSRSTELQQRPPPPGSSVALARCRGHLHPLTLTEEAQQSRAAAFLPFLCLIF